jgi:PAS domain-containing protein
VIAPVYAAVIVEPRGPTSDELLRAVLGVAGVRVAVIDRKGGFTLEPDPNVLSLPGERGAPPGANMFELYSDFPEAVGKVRQAFEGKEASISVDGLGGIIDASFLPWRGPKGEVDYVIAVAKYVTERRTAERQLDASLIRERRIFESNMVGMLVWDHNGAITDANDTLLAMVGHTRADLTQGRLDWVAMTPEEYRPLDQAALAEIKQRGACTPYEK